VSPVSDPIHNALVGIALLMLLLGGLLGIAWGLIALFGNAPLEDASAWMVGKLMCVLLMAGWGLLQMLVYRNYKSTRRQHRKEHRV